MDIYTARTTGGVATDRQSFRRFLIGASPAMVQLGKVIELVAPRRVTVLITGETGTGKEVVARALHTAGNRANNPFVAVNCTALPSTLVESELFGYQRGAFTGADKARAGRFEQAHRGTIFLDEIGDLPLESQGKLLRVLQEQEVERLGGAESIRVDVRVIAATNVSLEDAVRERRFREDLFYRLNVVPIHLTPLRERREDIPLLVEYFLEKIREAEASQPKGITSEAMQYLTAQNWPGNVRQLEHKLQMAFAMSGPADLIGLEHLSAGRVSYGRPQLVPPIHSTACSRMPSVTLDATGIDFDAVVAEFERSLVNQALRISAGNKARAAELLRMKRTTLLAKIKVLDLPKQEPDLAPAITLQGKEVGSHDLSDLACA